MSLDVAIDSAMEQDFVEFEKALKQEINSRIMNDPYMKKRKEDFEKYKQISNIYKSTNNIKIDDKE